MTQRYRNMTNYNESLALLVYIFIHVTRVLGTAADAGLHTLLCVVGVLRPPP